ncbi:ABC transporter ATP-binding protein [Spirochaeta cellobiosiphila]|uniref:ABC transporter ATP-binding protein n=1 Tax=Spirochaeta cellobiosiphila TaxID=504483 RepID=UPI0004193172|nr:ABC transporter ATP-binding protein [Spirochaeta cellobiosiphila]
MSDNKRKPPAPGSMGRTNAPARKAKDIKGTILRLVKYFNVRKVQLGIVVLLAIFSTAFNIIGPKLQGKVTTKLYEGFMGKFVAIKLGKPMPSLDFNYMEKILLLVLGLYLISALLGYLQSLLMSDVAQKIVFDIREEVNKKLHRLPLKYYDSQSHGEVMSRVTNDIDNIANTLQQSLTQFITSTCTILGILIMMLSISPLLTLISVLTLPTAMLGTFGIAKRSQKFFGDQQKELGNMNGHVEEMYSGFTIIKSFDRVEESKEKFSKINKNLGEAGWRAQFISGIVMPVMNCINNIGYVLICVVGGVLTSKNIIDLGDIQAFIQYSRRFNMPISQLSNIANVLQSTLASAERVFEVLDEPELEPDHKDAYAIDKPEGYVTFKDLQFGYLEDQLLMDGVNLKVTKGQTVAIVGPTGAGKTTLVNLLMRFYEINGGSISIDEHDVRDITRGSLRKSFGMVLQDTWLFKGSIKDNIAYGCDNATEEEIHRAAIAAHADHFIRALPHGYDTIINEEASNLSQGEKQLLTIARAILSDPAILILDEATSSVDTRTEVYIQKAMNRLMKGRTSFVIAHRLSTIRDAEKIIVMNKGNIIESGNHHELLEQKGFYADLYNSQFAE